MRRLPSFRRYVEGFGIDKQAELVTCPKAAKEEIVKLLDELQQQVCQPVEFKNMHLSLKVELFTCMTRCVHHLANDLPRRPLGRTIRVTYELCLTGKVAHCLLFCF